MESDIQLSKIAGRIIGEKMDTFMSQQNNLCGVATSRHMSA